MKLFSTSRSDWSEVTKYFDFYGDIPQEFVGQEAMYFSAKSETADLKRETADIEIGKITPRGDGSDGIYDIITSEDIGQRVPTKIRSQLLKNIKGNVVFPYEHLNQQQ